MHLRRLTCLTVAALSVSGAGAAASASADTLSGSGSTLIAPLMSRWAADFQGRSGTSIVYGAVGSGTGIKNIASGNGDFGASDAPLSANATGAACGQCVQIPWAVSATGLGYHVGALRNLRLNPAVIAEIYLGQIKSWNDPRIARLNRGTALPALTIVPVSRSDGSGDTYAFTDFLSGASSAFGRSVGRGTSVSFPAGISGKGNAGVTADVANTNGAIGYISASYLISAGLPAAAVQNRAGRFVKPNLSAIAAAARTGRLRAGNEIHIVNPPKSAKTAYPISTFTYVIGRRDGAKKSLLKSFIQYVLGPGSAFGPALDFPALPRAVKAADLSAVASF